MRAENPLDTAPPAVALAPVAASPARPHRLRAADLRAGWRLLYVTVATAHVLSGVVRVLALFFAGVLLALRPQGDEAVTLSAGAALVLGAGLTCVGDLALIRVRRGLHRPHPAVVGLTLAGLLLFTVATALIAVWSGLPALTLLALPSAVVLAALWFLERALGDARGALFAKARKADAEVAPAFRAVLSEPRPRIPATPSHRQRDS